MAGHNKISLAGLIDDMINNLQLDESLWMIIDENCMDLIVAIHTEIIF